MDNVYTKYDIDINRLKRDYIKEPLKKQPREGGGLCFEKPYEEDILYLYNECHLCLKFISDVLNVSQYTLVNWFKEFHIDRTNKELTKLIRSKTNMVLFGVDNYSELSECRAKVKKTKLERYGDETYTNREKAKQTNLERYGTEYPQRLDYIKEKQIKSDIKNHNGIFHTKTKEYADNVKQTCLEKYGVDNYTKTDEYKEKAKQTNLERYGVENPSQKHISQDTLEIINDKEKLIQYIKENKIINIIELSKQLNMSNSALGNYINRYDISNLFDYTGSLPEKEISDYINQYYETENNTRKYLNGKEIDIYIPKLKLGIEFNGNFWHNEYCRDKQYHQGKSLLAEEQGIFIYHIFEYEWNTKKNQILNQLNNLLGINNDKIYARKCVIKEVANKEKKQFLENNHLQGNDSSSIKLGLYYNNELVSLMTFCKPRFNKKYEYELSRFCSKSNCNVIGGASKLWNYFIKNYNPSSAISYSNIAHTKGNLYQLLTMSLQSISEPNYVWCKNYDIKTRYQCQKHKLLEQGYTGDSEDDIMHNLGYYKIYDCGNKVWVWK